jgi:putative tryptophan/tyrosine transport system substrate-binding protein
MMRILFSLMIAVGAVSLWLDPAACLAADKRIAVMWVGQAEQCNLWSKHFLARLKQIAPQVKVTLKMDLPDMATGEKVFRELESQVDGIVFLRSNGATFLGKAKPKIPCFVGNTNNPQELGVVANLEAPEGNITGATHYLPFEKRFAAIKTLFPKAQRIGLLLEKGHPGSAIDQKGTREQCEKLGMEYHELSPATMDELIAGAKDMAGKVDVMIMSSTALVHDHTEALVPICRTAKVPLFAYADSPVARGALASVGARSEVLGAKLADMVVDVVINGKPVSQVPVAMDPDPRISLNEEAMEAFALKLPPSVLRQARIVKKR